MPAILTNRNWFNQMPEYRYKRLQREQLFDALLEATFYANITSRYGLFYTLGLDKLMVCVEQKNVNIDIKL